MPASAKPVTLVALGDSLTAGYQLPASAALPAALERRLRAAGLDVRIENAGVSGDTASGGLDRLDWAVGEGVDGVIVALGANDMLRGIDPERTQQALDGIIRQLKAKRIDVLLVGMLASPSLGRDYVEKFNKIYPMLAERYDVPLYPFLLEGVAQNRQLNLADGIHPNRAGVEVIAKALEPAVARFVEQISRKAQ
ncbi:MAG: arylesterase [Beijerinckiaceae bacterium]|nr:arylesterase [Beijerinckiaceae bacterium]